MGESLKRQCPEDRRKRIAELQREIENLMDAIAAGQLRGSGALARRLTAAAAELERLEVRPSWPPRRTESTLDPKGTYASRPLARPWTGRLRPPASSARRIPRISGRATCPGGAGQRGTS